MEMEEFIKELVQESKRKPVVVEGKKDKAALEELGVHNVHPISRKPLFKFAEEIAKEHKEIILLLDIDREGRKIAHKLMENFTMMGLKVDRKFQREMKRLRISHVEGIGGMYHGQDSPGFGQIYNPRQDLRERRGGKTRRDRRHIRSNRRPPRRGIGIKGTSEKR